MKKLSQVTRRLSGSMASRTLSQAEKDSKKKSISSLIKSYPDFPKKGIVFRDIFPILRDPKAFKDCTDLFVNEIKETCPDVQVVLGLESRGFLFAPIVARELGVAFVPIRKAGKLPGEKYAVSYTLEYGKDTMEVAKDSIKSGQKVVVIDDLLATGGSLKAALELLDKANTKVAACLVLMELSDLEGRKKLNCPITSFVQVKGD